MLRGELMNPLFHVREDKNFVHIFDRDNEIGLIDKRTISIHNVKLIPGGKILMGKGPEVWETHLPLCCFYPHYRPREVLDNIKIRTANSGISISLQCHAPDEGLKHEVELLITYDGNIHSYIHERKEHLIRHRNASHPYDSSSKLEYFNFYLWGLDNVDRRYSPDGRRPSKWESVIFESNDRNIYRLPLNHYPRYNGELYLKNNAICGFFDHPDGNPVIQFLDDLGEKTELGLCQGLWDIHCWMDVNHAKKRDKKTEEYNFHFKIFNCPPKKRETLISKAVIKPLQKDQIKRFACPKLDFHFNTFDEILDPNEYFPGWYWVPFHNVIKNNWSMEPSPPDPRIETAVDHCRGRSDIHSLRVTNKDFRKAGWLPCTIGAIPVKRGAKYQISAYVKTRDWRGEGVYMAYSLLDNIDRPIHSMWYSDTIRGTADWRLLRLDVPEVSGGDWLAKSIAIYLIAEGKGTAWFDDLEFARV